MKILNQIFNSKFFILFIILLLILNLLVVNAFSKWFVNFDKLYCESILRIGSVLLITFFLAKTDFMKKAIQNSFSLLNKALVFMLIMGIAFFSFLLFNNGVDAEVIIKALLLSLAVGYFEEYYFRALLFSNLLQKRGLFYALLISSFLFSIIHLLNLSGGQSIIQTIDQCVYAFGVGTILGLMYWYLRSFIIIVLIHALSNYIFGGYYNISENDNLTDIVETEERISVSLLTILYFLLSIVIYIRIYMKGNR